MSRNDSEEIEKEKTVLKKCQKDLTESYFALIERILKKVCFANLQKKYNKWKQPNDVDTQLHLQCRRGQNIRRFENAGDCECYSCRGFTYKRFGPALSATKMGDHLKNN
ncbi:hypothetical protein RFI_05132 [Reticulomyxa filosa]|uniref:Uncharacterized protein n=1 Tax=Reticulomyxa filosa TaxID=46433 RepID=X6P0A1_RETFI|nr:hypothetical protein RFI_05132 [Reticulomyxa filosa]|eukprot:ETO31985.1 hypothetical protein RFI_05132 [Reticulomyxa filosa]